MVNIALMNTRETGIKVGRQMYTIFEDVTEVGVE